MYIYFNFGGYPTAYFNGTDAVVGGTSGTLNVYRNRYNSKITVPTPGVLSLKVDYNPSTRTGKIFTQFYSVDQIVESSLYLRYAITESHRYYHWGTGSPIPQDSLQSILRDMLPNYTGVAFSLEQGKTLADSQSFSISSGWVDHNCELVVFVQSDQNKSVLISNLIPLYQTHVSGDANGDRIVTISDVVFLTNYVLYGGTQPNPSASGDPNEDCITDMADVVYLINYLYLGGPAPLRGWEID
jgi:hypothetical protein